MNRINQFLNALDLQNMGKVGDHIRPHKPVMLLAVLDMIALHGQNRFDFSDELIAHFSAYFKLVQSGNDQCTPENPFWHLKNAKDDPLWEHVVREGAGEEYRCKEAGKKSGLSQKWIRDNIEFAALTPKWFSLLQTASARNTVRNSIVRRYFPKQADALLALCKEPEQPLLVGSPFAPLDAGQIIMQNDYAVAFFDRYRVLDEGVAQEPHADGDISEALQGLRQIAFDLDADLFRDKFRFLVGAWFCARHESNGSADTDFIADLNRRLYQMIGHGHHVQSCVQFMQGAKGRQAFNELNSHALK